MDDFGFGLEIELLLASADDWAPLSHDDLSLSKLLDVIDEIDCSDLGTGGLNVKPLHRRASHYLVEGYTLTDGNMNPVDLLPKGLEIRTPVLHSLEDTTACLRLLYDRLEERLAARGLKPVIISHHPVAENFHGPPNYHRHDYWQWAQTVMTTYGPDINISLPGSLAEKIERAALDARCNYYLPALTALTLASPLYRGSLWRIRGRTGKSIRTYRRSIWAPAMYVHEKPALRFEFKSFEMSPYTDDYHALFLACLALLLDDKLPGAASAESRIYDLGRVAVCGLEDRLARQRAEILLASAGATAARLGLDKRPLARLWSRLASGRTPSDDIADIFAAAGSVPATLKRLPGLQSGGESSTPDAVHAARAHEGRDA